MITLKTYPNPSETYGETVCVAGVRLDRGRPEWIRLYPADLLINERPPLVDIDHSNSRQFDPRGTVRLLISPTELQASPG